MATPLSSFVSSVPTQPPRTARNPTAREPMAEQRATPQAARVAGTGRACAPVSLALIDDNRLLRDGLAGLLQRQPGFKVLAAAADVDDGFEKVRASTPDVVLVDHELTTGDTLSLTARVHREVPNARVIVMGFSPLRVEVADYVLAGASGFILKGASFEELSTTIRAVASGADVLPEALTNGLFSQMTRPTSPAHEAPRLKPVHLTPRECQVVELLEAGRSNKEIAIRMQVAVHTVKSHVHSVLEKLGLRSRLEVVAFTHKRGGLDIAPAH